MMQSTLYNFPTSVTPLITDGLSVYLLIASCKNAAEISLTLAVVLEVEMFVCSLTLFHSLL